MAETLNQEQIRTPEKSPEELYREALEQKRDTLLAFHTMNSFRKGKNPEEMTSEQIEQYNVLRNDWQTKKEKSLASWESLPENKQYELAALGSRLYDVQAKLTLLGSRPVRETAPTLIPPASTEQTQQTPEQTSPHTVPKTSVVETQSEELSHAQIENKPETEITLEEAKRMHKFVSDKGHMLEAARWEAKIAELKERQKAEEFAKDREKKQDRIKELESILTEKYRVLHQEVSVVDRRPLEEEIKSLEDEKVRLEQELELPEGKVGKTWSDRIKNVFGKRKAEIGRIEAPAGQETAEQTEVKPEGSKQWTVVGWLAERAKGILSAGSWEVRQAWRFQGGTKLAANDLEALSVGINIENADEAQEKANEILQIMRENNITTVTAPEFVNIARNVTYEKASENNKRIEFFIKNAIETLKERVAKYRGQATAETVLTPANIKAVEDELRMQLNKFRDGATMADVKNFARVMRDNMDKRWWLRYIYAPLEASLLVYLGYHYLPWSRWFSGDDTDLISGGGTDVNLPEKDFSQRYMDNDMWKESKEHLEEIGVENPSMEDIQAVDSAAAQENNIHVVNPETNQTLWPETAGGQTKDINMMKGLIKWGAAHKVALAIKAARIASGLL